VAPRPSERPVPIYSETMRTPGLALTLLLMLAACSKPEATPPVAHQLAGAVVTPLSDLNLLRTKIPAVLLTALQAAALGEDLDGPKAPNTSLADRGRAELDEAAVGAVKNSAEALIPFRSWVRKLTGAERASRQVTKAIAAGIVRRAYLKGLGQAQGCLPPAAPRLEVPKP